MQTIQQIKLLQDVCQTCLIVCAIAAVIFLGAIVNLYPLHNTFGELLGYLFLGCASLGCVLLLIIPRLKCPVCHNIYVGKQERTLFTHTCRYCGRRSGDTS